MQKISRKSALWDYLPPDIEGLIIDGEKLIEHANKHGAHASTDFSYLVFPFSKAYEGFLKKFFLDLDIIQEDEYYGDDIRIGRILNPYFIRDHERLFERLCKPSVGKEDLVEKMWLAWKKGRNQVFHYFPHNFRRLNYKEALELVDAIIEVMHLAVEGCATVLGGTLQPSMSPKKPKKVKSIV